MPGPPLFALLALIVIEALLDLLVRSVGVDLAHWLGIKGWLQENLSKPSVATLTNLLTAAAAGTATILGLVISISLIAWQAERLRSPQRTDPHRQAFGQHRSGKWRRGWNYAARRR
jgi:hypothetical protein